MPLWEVAQSDRFPTPDKYPVFFVVFLLAVRRFSVGVWRRRQVKPKDLLCQLVTDGEVCCYFEEELPSVTGFRRLTNALVLSFSFLPSDESESDSDEDDNSSPRFCSVTA